MSAGEYCNREVVVVGRAESIRGAISLMRSQHVGDVIIVEQQGDVVKPLGILTDRDIITEILARDVDLDSVTVGDAMSDQLVTVTEDTKLLDAVSVMRNKGIRRLPVVDGRGSLLGILTVDDIIGLLAGELSNIAKLVATGQMREQKLRS